MGGILLQIAAVVISLVMPIDLILVAALLFIPAGTLRYWQGGCYLPLFNGRLNKLTLTN